MAYEQIISVNVLGQAQLTSSVNLTDKLAASTKTVNDMLYGEATAAEKLTLKIAQLAIEETKLEAVRERHRAQNDALAASAARAAAGQEQFSGATGKATGSVRDMTNALRVLEGGMPIRAAATFLTTIQGFGPVLSAAFPIIGAIALFGVVEKISDKLGLQINIWKRIEEAQKSSNDELKKASGEYDSLITKLKQLQDEEYKRRQGPIEAARHESFDFQQKAQTVDKQRIELLEREVAAVRAYTSPVPFLPGPGSQQAIYGGLAGLTTAGESLSTVGAGVQVKAAKALLPGLEKALSAARLQQEVDEASAKERSAQEDKEIDTKNKEAARAAAAAEERRRAAEARTAAVERSASDAYAKAFFGDEASPQRKLNIANVRIEGLRSSALEAKGADSDRINKAFDLEKIAAFVTFLDDSAESLRKFNEEVDHGVVIGAKIAEEQAKALEKAAHAGIDVGIAAEAPAPPPGYISPQQQLRSARDTGRRNLALYGAQARLAGLDEGTQAQGAYQLRVDTAEAEYKAAKRAADAKRDLVAADDALAKKDQELFDARLGHDQALLQIALQQKEAFQNIAVGLFNSAKSGNVGGFLKGELNKLEDTVVSNAAGLAWKSVAGIIPHAGAGSTLGTLLQGTAFGPDPMKTAGVTLTKAGADLITAAARLSALSPSGGGGSAGGLGIPGIGGGGGASASDASSGDYGGEYGAAVSVPALSSAKPSSTGKIIGTVAGIGAAAYGAYSGFKAGGAQGIAQGIGSMAGAAAIVDPEPVSKAILAGVAAVSGIIGSLFGDPKANRAAQIQSDLQHSQYMAPVAINASMTTGGTFADFDRFGQTRGSGLSPFPTIEQGFFDYRHDTVVPGRTDSQFGGRGGGTPVIVQVQTLDSRSFNDNSHLVADAVVHAMDTGKATSLQERLRNY